MGKQQVPIFGVNLGSLGFLTNAPLDQLYRGLETILAGEGIVDERSTFRVRLFRNGETIREEMAINDVVVAASAIARVIEVRITTSQGFVATVLGDGGDRGHPDGIHRLQSRRRRPGRAPGGGRDHPGPGRPAHAHPATGGVPRQRRTVADATGPEAAGPRNFRRPGEPAHASRRCTESREVEIRLRLLSLPDQNYFRVLRKKLLWSALPPKRARAVAPEPPRAD